MGAQPCPVALVPAEECGRKPRSWSAETAVAWPGPPRIGMKTEVFDVGGDVRISSACCGPNTPSNGNAAQLHITLFSPLDLSAPELTLIFLFNVLSVQVQKECNKGRHESKYCISQKDKPMTRGAWFCNGP